MIPHKRHFALHGLIAITLLVPVLLFYYLFKVNIVTHETAVPIWVDDDKMQHALDSHKRDYTTIKITGDKERDIEQMQKAQDAVRDISAANDTIKGVHFYFDKHSKYNEFVEALNILQVEKPQIFILMDNHLWVFNTECSDYGVEAEKIPMIYL
jgi:biopolymer transport protein ExbD